MIIILFCFVLEIIVEVWKKVDEGVIDCEEKKEDVGAVVGMQSVEEDNDEGKQQEKEQRTNERSDGQNHPQKSQSKKESNKKKDNNKKKEKQQQQIAAQKKRLYRRQQHLLKKALTYVEYLFSSNSLASTSGVLLRKNMAVDGYVPALFAFQSSGWLKSPTIDHPDTLKYNVMWNGLVKHAKKSKSKLELDLKNECIRIKGTEANPTPWVKWLYPNPAIEGGYGCPKWCRQKQLTDIKRNINKKNSKKRIQAEAKKKSSQGEKATSESGSTCGTSESSIEERISSKPSTSGTEEAVEVQ